MTEISLSHSVIKTPIDELAKKYEVSSSQKLQECKDNGGKPQKDNGDKPSRRLDLIA